MPNYDFLQANLSSDSSFGLILCLDRLSLTFSKSFTIAMVQSFINAFLSITPTKVELNFRVLKLITLLEGSYADFEVLISPNQN